MAPASANPEPESGFEIQVNKEELLKELSHTQGVIARKSTVPILSSFLFETAANHLLITATDLDLSLRTVCPAQIKKPGSCTLPGRKFYEYVRLLGDGEITIKTLPNDWVSIRSGRSHTKLVGLARKNFPNLPLFPANSAIALPQDVVRTMIARTIFAISQEETRYTLNGALLILQPDAMTMVATDGHRLAHVKIGRNTAGLTSETRVLIPRKALAEIYDLLNSEGSNVFQFASDESHLFFRIGTRLLTSRRLAGSFPNHEAVMPKDYAGSLALASKEFGQALQRVAQFSDQRSNAVRLKAENHQLCLSSSCAETGESEEILEASYTGTPLATGFNSHYLLDFLKVLETEKLAFLFNESSTAAEFRPAEGADSPCEYRYIVMPMRT